MGEVGNGKGKVRDRWGEDYESIWREEDQKGGGGGVVVRLRR